MKKYFLFFIFSALVSFETNAQTYQYVPFPTENAIWSEFYTTEELQNPPWFYHYYDKIAMTGDDTIINSKIYKKLFLFNESVFNINNASYLGGIREENKKIYYFGDTIRSDKPLFRFQEILLYDFSLNIGDTLPSAFDFYCNFLAFQPYPLIVSEIDTVLIGNKLRKVIKFLNEPGIAWVEGIGSLKGLLFCTSNLHVTGSDPNGTLICFKQNDTIVYFDNNYSECMPLNVSIKPAISNNITISPNPATTQLILTLSENTTNTTYSLYDMQGCIQITGKMLNSQTVIDVETLPRGLYTLKIINAHNSITKKVVLLDNKFK